MKYLLGLDNGGTVVKAGLYDAEGNAVAFAGEEAPSIAGRGGIAERDMNVLWETNASVIRKVMEKSGVRPEDIACLAISGHGNGLYMVDDKGAPVMNGIYSSDTRAASYTRRHMTDGTYEKILPKTMQILYAGQPTSLLAWFADHKPYIPDKAKWAFSCNDYLRFRLTGEANGEITGLSAESVLDSNTGEYDQEVFEALEVGQYRRLFPPICKPCEICGTVTEEAAADTGLLAGTPVAGGMLDMTACVLATGITDSSKLCVIAGTWGINEYIAKVPVVAEGLFLTSIYCMEDYYLVSEGSMTSASNLEWFVRRLMKEEKANLPEGKSVYEAANEMVAGIAPEESNIVFLPFLYGTNVNTDARACFMGVSGWHEKAHLVRAVYEGVVFSHMDHIEKLLSFRDRPKSVRIAGGVAKSRVWVQMFADILQMPVEVSDIGELGTLGAAMCAGKAAGVYGTLEEAAKKCSRIAYTCEPDASKKEIYQKKYALYKQIIGAMEPIWQAWNF